MWFLMPRLIISRTGDGRRIVRRVAYYYAGVVARVDAMAFATFDGGGGVSRPISPRLPCWAFKVKESLFAGRSKFSA